MQNHRQTVAGSGQSSVRRRDCPWRIANLHYSQAHTNARLATQAANSATDSVTCTRSHEVCWIVPMAGQSIGRFYPESLAGYFSPDSGLVYDSRETRGRSGFAAEFRRANPFELLSNALPSAGPAARRQ